MNQIIEMLNPEKILQNTYMSAILSLFLVMYGPRLQPKLPDSVKNVFENRIFRGLVIFLINYLSSNNIQLSIVITLVFLVTMNLIHNETIIEKLQNRNEINGPAVNSDIYTEEDRKAIGTDFYPLNH